MPKYSVDEVLEIIQNLTVEEKSELQQRLPSVLAPTNTPANSAMALGSQHQQISGASISGSMGVELNQIAADRGSTIAQSETQAQLQADNLEAAVQALEQLKDAIAQTPTLSAAEQQTVADAIATLEPELKQPKPDKNAIGQAVEALQQGLAGVEVLAGPVKKVANLLAKLWIPG